MKYEWRGETVLGNKKTLGFYCISDISDISNPFLVVLKAPVPELQDLGSRFPVFSCMCHWRNLPFLLAPLSDGWRAACFLSHLWPNEGQTSSTFSTSSKLCKSFGGWDLWGLCFGGICSIQVILEHADCSWCIVGYVQFYVQLQNESRKQHCFTLKRSRCLLSALSSPANICIGRKSFMDQQATRMSNTSQLPLSLHFFFGFPTCNLDLCIFESSPKMWTLGRKQQELPFYAAAQPRKKAAKKAGVAMTILA